MEREKEREQKSRWMDREAEGEKGPESNRFEVLTRFYTRSNARRSGNAKNCSLRLIFDSIKLTLTASLVL